MSAKRRLGLLISRLQGRERPRKDKEDATGESVKTSVWAGLRRSRQGSARGRGELRGGDAASGAHACQSTSDTPGQRLHAVAGAPSLAPRPCYSLPHRIRHQRSGGVGEEGDLVSTSDEVSRAVTV